jgi:hypothetical protein
MFQAPTQRVLSAAAGKPAEVALSAVMRKLIVLMNQILKHPNFALQNYIPLLLLLLPRSEINCLTKT